MSEPQNYSTATIYRRFLAEARPYWPHVAAVLVLNVLAAPLKLLMPLPVKIALDHVIEANPLPAILAGLIRPFGDPGPNGVLVLACSLLVLFTLLTYLNGLAIWILGTYTREKLLLRFRSKLLTHLQELPLTYHDNKGTSDSTYRIQYDAQAIQWIVLDGIQPFLTSSLTVLAMLFVIAWIDWQLALVAIALIPVLMLLIRGWSGRLRRQWNSAKQLQSSAMSVVQESLGGLRLVKAFGAENREQTRFAKQSTAGLEGQMRVAMSQGTFDLTTGTVFGIATAAALFIGIRHVSMGMLTIGDFWLVWAYLAQLFGPLQMIGNRLSTLQGALASADRALVVLDEMPKVAEKPDAKPLERTKGRFSVEEVTFGYVEHQPVLKDISMEIAAGDCVGIVGSTGSGKTTLAALLMRFYDPDSGRILLDGVDLRDYRLKDLRSQFSVVLQDPILFSASIAENIAYGRPDATMEEIEAAAEAANAHLFIQQAESGYHALVGDRGMKLSGGERQRIALARAYLRNAPLLILDEPTSAVDLHTESLICEALERLTEGRTTFLITHRPSLLRLCDAVWDVEEGRVTPREANGDWSVTGKTTGGVSETP